VQNFILRIGQLCQINSKIWNDYFSSESLKGHNFKNWSDDELLDQAQTSSYIALG
jgi:hypothetical protein